MSEWKPIATAPTGRTILIWRPVRRAYELVQATDNDYDWMPYKADGLDRPSHWMFPPSPPQRQGARKIPRRPASKRAAQSPAQPEGGK